MASRIMIMMIVTVLLSVMLMNVMVFGEQRSDDFVSRLSHYSRTLRRLVDLNEYDLIRGASGRKIYRYEKGSLHAFPNLNVFIALGYDFDIDKVHVISDIELKNLPVGNDLNEDSLKNPKAPGSPSAVETVVVPSDVKCELDILENTTHHQRIFGHPKFRQFLCTIKQPIDPVVDKKLHEFHKVYHTGNLCPFQRKVFEKFARGQDIVIEVLGGSETWGVDLVNRDQEKWTSRLDKLLNSGWYGGKFIVINRAIRACGIDAWIWQTTRFVGADLVIVDASVNDQALDLQSLPHHYKYLIERIGELPNAPALFFVQLFRLTPDNTTKSEVFTQCPLTYGHCCEHVLFCPQWWDMHDFVTGALQTFKVPYVSYRDLVWPNYDSPPDNLLSFWNGMSHPDRKVHALIGKMVAYSLVRQLEEAHKMPPTCEAGSVFSQKYIVGDDSDKELKSICIAPLAKMVADNAESRTRFQLSTSSPSGSNLRWKYYDDIPSKFGWLLYEGRSNVSASCGSGRRLLAHATGAYPANQDNQARGNGHHNKESRKHMSRRLQAGSSHLPHCSRFRDDTRISFDVEFSTTKPILQLSYLKSWSEDMGSVVVWLDNSIDEHVIISGFWTAEYSVSHMITLTASPIMNVSALLLGETAVLKTITPGKHVLNIAAGDFNSGKSQVLKWKLIGITAC